MANADDGGTAVGVSIDPDAATVGKPAEEEASGKQRHEAKASSARGSAAKRTEEEGGGAEEVAVSPPAEELAPAIDIQAGVVEESRAVRIGTLV